MKRKLVSSIITGLIVVSMSVSVFAGSASQNGGIETAITEVEKSNNDEFDAMYEQVLKEYESDPQFIQMTQAYGEEYAREFLNNIVNERMETKQTRGGGGDQCYQHVKNIRQTKTYNCGSTTTLQTLYGINCAGNVTGATDAAKIATLDKEYNIDAQGSMIVYQVRDALNKYSRGKQTYSYVAGSSLTLAAFEDRIAKSLTNGKPVILHARTEEIGYYNQHPSGHYLSLDSLYRTTKKVRIVDCNYNLDYYGVHNNVTLQEAYNSITKARDRYLIY